KSVTDVPGRFCYTCSRPLRRVGQPTCPPHNGLLDLLQLSWLKYAEATQRLHGRDARLLLSKLKGSAQEIWSRVEPFVPRSYLDKASYAFDDLWDSIHGAPDSH